MCQKIFLNDFTKLYAYGTFAINNSCPISLHLAPGHQSKACRKLYLHQCCVLRIKKLDKDELWKVTHRSLG
jgi:hypothetical protein